MPTIYPILLCGGSGRRLWPISRQSYPKQFSRIIGNNSLLQQSALRFKSSKIIQFEPHLILTNLDFRFIVQEQLNDVLGIGKPVVCAQSSPESQRKRSTPFTRFPHFCDRCDSL